MKRVGFRLKNLILVFLLFFTLFSVNNTKRVHAETNTYIATQSTYAGDSLSFTVKLYNHDATTFNSVSVVMKDPDGNVIDSWSANSVDSFSRRKEHNTDPENQTGLWLTHNTEGLNPRTTYTYEITFVSPYQNHFYWDEERASEVRIYNLERILVTKTWDDAEDSSRRPTAEEYKSMLKFKDNGVAVDNPRIELISDSNNEYKYYVYGVNIRNKIEVDEIVPDNYMLSEKTDSEAFLTPSGSHNWSDNVSIASLKNNIQKYMDLKLRKVDFNTNDPLANVVFDIINNSGVNIIFNDVSYADGEVIATVTTGSDGVVSVEDLPYYGKYTITEKANNNEGYLDPTWSKKISSSDITYIDTNLIDLGDVTNEKKGFGGFKLIKVDSEDETILLENAEFELWNVSGESITLNDANHTVVEDNTVISTFSTGSDGTYTVDKILPNDGKYKLVEKNAPEGYILLNSEIDVTVNYDTISDLTVKNNAIPYGVINIKKRDALTREDLLGAKFKVVYTGTTKSDDTPEIYLKNGDGPFSVGDVVYEIDMTSSASFISDDIFPTVSINNNPIRYALVEVQAPENYYPYANTYGTIEIEGVKYPVVDNNIVLNPAASGRTVSIDNHPLYGIKIDKVDSADNNVKLKDATFDIIVYTDTTVVINGREYAKGDKVGSVGPTDENGSAESGKILAPYDINGRTVTYRLVETQFPEGYVPDDATSTYYNNFSYSTYYINDGYLTKTMKNKKQEYTSFTLKKVDEEGNPLLGSRFAVFINVPARDVPVILKDGRTLYDMDFVMVVDLTQNSEYTSDSIFPIYGDDGRGVRLDFVEITTPEHYTVNPTGITYTYEGKEYKAIKSPGIYLKPIDSENTNEVIVTNTKMKYGGIELRKVDEEGNLITDSSATFKLYNDGSKAITLYDGRTIEPNGLIGEYSTVNGVVEIGKDSSTTETTYLLPVDGKYRLEETAAPSGYKISTQTTSNITVNDSELTQVSVTNKKIVYFGIDVTKRDRFFYDLILPGAEFDLVNKSGTSITLKDGTKVAVDGVIIHFVTDENGKYSIPEILPELDDDGNKIFFNFIETKAPENYVTSDHIFRYYGNGNSPETYSLDNYRKFGFLGIEKGSDSVNPDTFEFEITLLDGDGQPVNDWYYYITESDFSKYTGDYPYKDIEGVDLPKVEFVDGKATVSLTTEKYDGYGAYTYGFVGIFDIPLGYSYEVKEIRKEGWHEDYEYYSYPTNGVIENNSWGDYVYFSNSDNEPEDIEIELEAKKILENGTLNDGQFTFELLDKDKKVIGEATNDAQGNIRFEGITIKAFDLNYRHILYREATDEEKALTNRWFDGRGNAGKEGVYTGQIPAGARGWSSDFHEYFIYSEATDEQKATVAIWNDGDTAYMGEYESPSYVWYYTLFEDDLTYYIREKISADTSGYVYDEHLEEVKVHVIGPDTGELEATISYDDDGAVFTNEEFKEIRISKQDLGGKELPGAKIKVTGDGYTEEWVSTSEPHILYLKPGEYKLQEVVAPAGYKTITTIVRFSVDSEGKVTLQTASVNNGGKIELIDGVIVLKDAPVPDTPKYEIPKTGL